ncbi:hypothetical protein ACHAWT_003484 [Skeletonema menzelii]
MMSLRSTALVACSIIVMAGRAEAFHLQPSTSSSSSLRGMEQNAQQLEATEYLSRRKIIGQLSSLALFPIMTVSTPALASNEAFVRTPSPNDKFKFSYTVTPPPAFEPGNKPLKTHLDEINFSIPDVRGYTLGVTVDPVRISSIKDFGTPEEVAARVVTAEVNRDGVFEVTLAKDPVEDSAGCYDIEYISDGKRGKKRFATRIYIKDGFLYVLTVQSKEAEFDEAREKEVQACIKSFRPL